MYEFRFRVYTVLSYLQVLSASNINVGLRFIPAAATHGALPSTLLLPSGFNPQLPPRQPMLYPFVVPTTPTTPATTTTKSPAHIFGTAGWIPISSSSIRSKANGNELRPIVPTTLAAKTQTQLGLEDRISKYVVTSSAKGPIFESIIYGTWKPDPPLQPVTMTTLKTIAKHSRNDEAADSPKAADGRSKVLDESAGGKTISRQHGGFIDNKQHSVHSVPNSLSNDSHSMVMETEQNTVAPVPSKTTKTKRRKYNGKQGRRKIRPYVAASFPVTNTTPRALATPATTSTLTPMLATGTAPAETTHMPSPPSVETNADVTEIKPIESTEVVRQINDSVEVKYNHKQTSTHSIEMGAHERLGNHRMDDFYDYEAEENEEQKIVTAAAMDGEDDVSDEDSGGSSVISMNWPTDFINSPPKSSTSTDQPSSQEATSRVPASEPVDSSELPLALSSLNIPPSLWPKISGNITKLGSPYTAANSLEEAALCVPITVQEYNMMNSLEVVNIEKVFCFPMPSTVLAKKFLQFSPTTTIRSDIARSQGNHAKVHNFDDFYEAHSGGNSRLSTALTFFTLAACVHSML